MTANNRHQLLLTFTFVFASLALFDVLLIWVTGLLLIASIIRLSLIYRHHQQAITQRTLNLLALLSLVVLFWYGWQIGLMNSMLNLLVLACSFKLIKLEHEKDFQQLCLSTLFIIACGFIFYQQVVAVVLYSVLVATLLLAIQSYIQPGLPLATQVKELTKQIGFAIPIAVVMFIALPHLPPLWQMPGMNQTKTGLSDVLNPGDLSQVAQSAELAFSAEFKQSIPVRTQLYWRAQVMEVFDGQRWSRHPYRERQQHPRNHQRLNPEVAGDNYQYRVIAQPNNTNWLYGLDIAVSSSEQVTLNPSYQLTNRYPYTSAMSYEVTSWYQSPLIQASAFDLDINLQTPAKGNLKTRDLAQSIQHQYSNQQQQINAVLGYFKQHKFLYTLHPERMPVDMVDTFLFEKQKGFCAHYAASMAYLLRLMDIPARVVTGYMGGEVQSANILNVYQFDAHAWVEAWQGKQGWVRYDPTAVVSPERLLYGLEQAVAYENSFLAEQPFSLMKFKSVRWLNQLRLAFAQMDYWWNSWVVGFNQRQQLSIVAALFGSATLTSITLFSVSTFALICFFIAVYYWRNQAKSPEPPAQYFYFKALKLLAKYGFERQPNCGPSAFLQELKTKAPLPVVSAFLGIHNCYVQTHYAGKLSLPVSELKRKTRQLKQSLNKAQTA